MTREDKRREILEKLINDFVEIDQLYEQAKPPGIIEIREKEAKAYNQALSRLKEIELEELNEKKIDREINNWIAQLIEVEGYLEDIDGNDIKSLSKTICSKFGRRKIKELDEGKLSTVIDKNPIRCGCETAMTTKEIEEMHIEDVHDLAQAINQAYKKGELI